MEKKQKMKLHPEAREILAHFYKHYPPAVDVYDTRLFISTERVLDRIQTIKHSRYLYLSVIEEFLKSAGYVLESMGSENDKRWLVKFAPIKYEPLN